MNSQHNAPSLTARILHTRTDGFAQVAGWIRNPRRAGPRFPTLCALATLLLAIPGLAPDTIAQDVPRPGGAGGPQSPPVLSPEFTAERQLTFRISAPRAQEVHLASSDLPGDGFGQGRPMIKGENGVWEITLSSVDPGSYRYNFNVDGVSVIDPRNPATSEANENTWSLVHVSGAAFMDTRDVPRGAVSEVTYWSSTLNRFRRLHVYTPPGYESGEGRFPILYLLHGAFDCDDSWTTVGRAGFILDNLIADGQAKPMVVIMPHGHTGPFRFGMRFTGEFEREFVADIMPQMENRYRVHSDRKHRAMAGLSMGGAHTLNIGIPQLDKFAYLGVFSSGIFGIAGGPGGNPPQGPTFEETHATILENAAVKEGLRLFWFATGKDDFLLETSRASVAMFKKHHFDVAYRETEGAHTWIVWRQYLHEFAPQLFQ
jgi:enterochelin esterase-like enzyme